MLNGFSGVALSLLYLGAGAWCCRKYWQRYCRRTGHTTLNYRRSDLYAMGAGLSLTLVLLLARLQGAEMPLLLLPLAFCTQLAGGFIGRLAIDLQPPVGKAGQAESAFGIIMGALVAPAAATLLLLLLSFVTESPALAAVTLSLFGVLIWKAKKK